MRLNRLHLAALAIVAVTASIAIPLIGADEKPAARPPAVPAAEPSAAPRRVKVLFLGDDGHHKPLERFRQAASDMTRRGVDLTYVDDLNQITPENLKRFDVLALYANITKAPPAVEKAILEYVEAGGGYAVIHCGSFCFQNSRPLVALTGGQFKRHGTGVFKETHVKPEHPILKGLHEIESWDESYVHEKHNEAGRELLSTRDDKEGKEPYTWTRTQGKGRVFYTAWGHDERTWGNKDFLDLLERGMRWSAGDWALQPTAALPAATYGEGRAPNYVNSKEWGKQGDIITKIPQPMSVADSMKHLITPPGVEAKLFAAEPKIFKPIAMNWDARGRLWIAETIDYPNELKQEGQGRDRISIVEDTDGDGVADKFTVFADKLSIPTSFCFANGGVVVVQAPHTLFLKDTNGDDVADERKVLFTGWGTRDTHAGPSSLRYGLDNWIYGIVGYSGFNGEVGGKQLRFSQGIWRMKPDGSAVEFLGGLTNNAWGLGFSEEGHVFAGTANSDPSFYLHIPNRAYESVKGLTVKRLPNIADLNRMFVAAVPVRQVDHHGAYTAAAGHSLYTARTWPSYYWNRTAFISEPTGHIVGQFLLQPKGAGFVARNDASLLQSTDEWTSPIFADVGPDGQVWVIDWYNFVVQHNPIPKGFEAGKGGAYESNLRDKTHGRIYRLVYGAGTPSKTFDLTKADNATLLNALRSDNQLWRMHAQRLLVEKGDKSVADDLVKLAGDRVVDGIGLNPVAIHALWTLKGLGVLEDANSNGAAAATQALGHPSAGVRKAAVDVLPRTEAGMAALLKAKSLDDADPQVRKSALLALAEMPATAATGEAVYAALARKDNLDDRWLTDAITIAGARHDAGFIKAALASFKAADPGAADAPPPAVNLMPNPSFEEEAGTGPKSWKVRHYVGTAEQTYATGVARTGTHSLMIKSTRGADSSWFADVRVEPNTKYRLSAWVKTDGLKKSTGAGAMLNIHGTDFRSDAVEGTADWRQVSVEFNSGRTTTVSINCLYGGYGLATGVAYWDDIELVKVTGGASSALAGDAGRVVGTVITHYASRAPKESVVQTLAALKTAQPAMATLIIDALSASWPDGKAAAPELSAADVTELNAVMTALPQRSRDRLLTLATKWGRADMFGDALAGMTKELSATLADAKQPAAKRGDAAKRLLALADSPENTAAVVKLVTATAGPEVQTELLAALADSKVPAVGEQLVGQWMKMSPAAQRIGLSTLLRRDPWTKALLAGVKANTINPKDLQPQQWDALTRHADAAIAAEAKEVQKNSGQVVSADRKAIVDKLLPLAAKQGNVEKGKLVYAKNCQVCHLMDNAGGKVGPDLTGVGARPKADILMEVLDPNRSVEGTFRQWAARTTDDEVITGRLLSESQTSVEIIDATGQVFAIQRDKLKTLNASDRSVMPEGFEALPAEDLVDLLEYLETSKVKH